MSDPTDVQDFIDRANAERGRGGNSDDAPEKEDESSHNERLRQSILEEAEGN